MKLLGPIPWFDMVRLARRRQHFILRVVYGLVLLLALYLTYTHAALGAGGAISINDYAWFGETFFANFMAVQYVALLILTPAFVAGAVAEDKATRTLDYLLTTHLTDREIVLGKLAARLAHVALLFLSGVPIVSLLLLFGGIEPALLAGGFALTVSTLLTTGGLAIFFSVCARKPAEAVAGTYIMLAPILVCAGVLSLFFGYLSSGRPSLAQPYWVIALVQPLIAGPAVIMAVGNLRRIYLRQLDVPIRNPHTRARPPRPRGVTAVDTNALRPRRRRKRRAGVPAVGAAPILWKELYIGVAPEVSLFAGQTQGSVSIGWVLLAVGVAGAFFGWLRFITPESSPAFLFVVRLIGTPIAIAVMLAVMARAAASFSAERVHQTLDTLLNTPLSHRAILGGKWWGSVGHPRAGYFALAIIWLGGALSGGLHPWSLAALLTIFGVQIAFLASLGLAISTRTATPARAQTWTLGIAVFLGLVGPLLLPWAAATFDLPLPSSWIPALRVGLMPIVLLVVAAAQTAEFPWPGLLDDRLMFVSVIATASYAVTAWLLWRYALGRFRRQYARIDDCTRPPRK